MNISDLSEIKKKLLQKHKQYEVPNPEEYREGVLGGLTVALNLIDQMMESESEAQERYYREEDQ